MMPSTQELKAIATPSCEDEVMVQGFNACA